MENVKFTVSEWRTSHPPCSHGSSGQLAYRLCLGGWPLQWDSGWPGSPMQCLRQIQLQIDHMGTRRLETKHQAQPCWLRWACASALWGNDTGKICCLLQVRSRRDIAIWTSCMQTLGLSAPWNVFQVFQYCSLSLQAFFQTAANSLVHQFCKGMQPRSNSIQGCLQTAVKTACPCPLCTNWRGLNSPTSCKLLLDMQLPKARIGQTFGLDSTASTSAKRSDVMSHLGVVG